jgi:hypothetical protein
MSIIVITTTAELLAWAAQPVETRPPATATRCIFSGLSSITSLAGLTVIDCRVYDLTSLTAMSGMRASDCTFRELTVRHVQLTRQIPGAIPT